ncbi:hypothetical protein EDB83DRAFT_1348301 [Lactarius deliciosus]|nr:hypothetical protein EDB83DRAFT_1348301 [Lactarius deliciosus]
MGKISEGCQCIKPCSGSTPSPPSKRNAEQFSVSKKRRRISLDSPHSGPRAPAVWGHLDLDQYIETTGHRTRHGPVERTLETENPVQDRMATVQTPSGRKFGGSDSYSENVHTESGDATLATRLSAIVTKPPPIRTVSGKGMAPPTAVFRHSMRAMGNPISFISSRVSCFIHIEVCRSHLCAQPPAVPGKRFILFDDDDDDDDDDI